MEFENCTVVVRYKRAIASKVLKTLYFICERSLKARSLYPSKITQSLMEIKTGLSMVFVKTECSLYLGFVIKEFECI